MRYAILSDVHANLEALEAVLSDLRLRNIDKILFLGDAVGYGPNPNECVEILKDCSAVMLAGNHDHAVVGLTSIEYFNDYASFGVEWTQSVLTPENFEFLKSLKPSSVLESDDIFIVHSTPKEPEEWHYLLSLWDADVNFRYFQQKVCFLGHSHRSAIIEQPESGEMVTYKQGTDLKAGNRYIVNAGSVGQPRDGDPRACYAIITDGKVEFIRVKYDIEKTQEKMRNAGLPAPLIERLAKGA